MNCPNKNYILKVHHQKLRGMYTANGVYIAMILLPAGGSAGFRPQPGLFNADFMRSDTCSGG
jgi:hypothetical protein